MNEDRRSPRALVLTLLTLAYALNFVDRQVLVIAAPALKLALHLTDAELGLLYGTAFALFYALFGLALARLADGWNRVLLLALALAWWSGMTALSAAATGFVGLALLRVGVGFGEASAAPAAFSLIADHFPPARRGTALSINAAGIYLGIGGSLALGGMVLAGWARLGPHPPLGLAGWQATFLACGVPGLLLAGLVGALLREPVRGAIEGRPRAPDRAGLAAIPRDLALFVPGLATVTLARMGAGARTLAGHVLLLAGCAAGALLLAHLSDLSLPPERQGVLADLGGLAVDTALLQWGAIAIGVHAASGWLLGFRLRQPDAWGVTAGSARFRLLALGGGVLSIASYGIAGFLFVYGKRYAGLSEGDGVALGLIAAATGIAGTAGGGVLADRVFARRPDGRVVVAIAAVALSTLFTASELIQSRPLPFLVLNALATITLTGWLGPVFAAGQEEVPADARGIATGLQFLAINLVGLGLGPYLTGLLSDAGGSLRGAMLTVLAAAPVALLLFAGAARLSRRAPA